MQLGSLCRANRCCDRGRSRTVSVRTWCEQQFTSWHKWGMAWGSNATLMCVGFKLSVWAPTWQRTQCDGLQKEVFSIVQPPHCSHSVQLAYKKWVRSVRCSSWIVRGDFCYSVSGLAQCSHSLETPITLRTSRICLCLYLRADISVCHTSMSN